MPNRSTATTKERSRRLRQEATDAERRLWSVLRLLKAHGYHFRRQVPFGTYVLDFAEHNRRLVIEVDGDQHGFPENRLRDEQRDRFLRSNGYSVLRVSNADVGENLEGVIAMIMHLSPPPEPLTRFDLPSRGR